MIVKTHPPPVKRQAELLEISRSNVSPLVTATTMTSVLSSADFPRNAIAVLTGIVSVWLVNEPSAEAAGSAAEAGTAHVRERQNEQNVNFIRALLARGRRAGDRPTCNGRRYLPCAAAGAWAYMLETRAPIGMQPVSSSSNARHAKIFTSNPLRGRRPTA